MMFTGRRRWSIAGHHIHKKMDADLAKIVKDDGSDTRDDTDTDKIQGPQAGPGYPGREILSPNFRKLLLNLFQG